MAFWSRLFRNRKQKPSTVREEVPLERHVNIDGSVSLTTTGVAEKGSRELRIDAVPAHLEQHAGDLLHRLGELAAREKFQLDGETIGGPLVHDSQPVIHAATLRLASRTTDPGSEELFRLVDWNEPVSYGFPLRLMATHLAVVAEREPTSRRLELLGWSIELFVGEPARFDTTFGFQRGENVGNWFGWSLLGESLVEAGRVEEGLRALEEAVLRCPAWADDFAAHVTGSVERTGADVREDPRLQFWLRYAAMRR